MPTNIIYPDLSEKIINAFYEVCRNLSVGYSEKVYESAYVYELQQLGLKVEEQVPLKVMYKDIINVGNFVADIIVEGKIIIELKAVAEINDLHISQLINYLTTTHLPLGYVVNFGGIRHFKRILGPAAKNLNATR